MLFNSIAFAIFLPIVLSITFLLQGKNLYKKIFLIIASFFFYMYWKPAYGWLLAGSITFNYFFAQLIGKTSDKKKRKLYLIFTIAGNLLFLSFYKYANFIIDNINSVVPYINLSPFTQANILLPIGISFFTFQAMSYVIDIYKRRANVASFVDTTLYISFFPQLIAGPIVRANQIIHQFSEAKAFRKDNFTWGTHRIFWGLIKKMVVADNLAIFVNQVFSQHQDYGWASLLIAAYAFGFQIYCDFSGYSDIAIGCFKIMGYSIPENFNLPYMASSFSNFWKRWHISLSSWLKDYLYIPLGGNRKSVNRVYLNIMITMFLGGLWHGAKWTFVIWGALHGAYIVAEKMLEKRRKLPDNPLFQFLKVFIIFQLVSFAWIFFRAESLSSAMGIATSIVTLKGGIFSVPAGVWVLLAAMITLHIAKSRFLTYDYFMSLPYYVRYFVYSSGIFLLFFNKSGLSSQFIYFQF